MLGSRIVALDFDPQPGYWQSANGIALVQQASEYARQGATSLSIETLYSAIRPGEAPSSLRTCAFHASKSPAPR